MGDVTRAGEVGASLRQWEMAPGRLATVGGYKPGTLAERPGGRTRTSHRQGPILVASESRLLDSPFGHSAAHRGLSALEPSQYIDGFAQGSAHRIRPLTRSTDEENASAPVPVDTPADAADVCKSRAVGTLV